MCAGMDAQLVVHALEMGLDGSPTDPQPRGDLDAGRAIRREEGDLELSRCEGPDDELAVLGSGAGFAPSAAFLAEAVVIVRRPRRARKRLIAGSHGDGNSGANGRQHRSDAKPPNCSRLPSARLAHIEAPHRVDACRCLHAPLEFARGSRVRNRGSPTQHA